MNIHKRSWKSYIGAAAIAVAIAMVLNPEIRAMLLLADVLGLETIFLLLAAQVRSYWPMLRPVVQSIAVAVCRLSSSVGVFALRASQVVQPFRPLPALLGPVFVALSYGVQCPMQNSGK